MGAVSHKRPGTRQPFQVAWIGEMACRRISTFRAREAPYDRVPPVTPLVISACSASHAYLSQLRAIPCSSARE